MVLDGCTSFKVAFGTRIGNTGRGLDGYQLLPGMIIQVDILAARSPQSCFFCWVVTLLTLPSKTNYGSRFQPKSGLWFMKHYKYRCIRALLEGGWFPRKGLQWLAHGQRSAGTIWLFNSSPWQDPPFLRTVNHLFLWAIFHGYVK